jgi:dienelactone hydrolase
MGWSMGGTATLEVSTFPEGGFRAAVAFYPNCKGWEFEETVPVLLLMGELDDWAYPRNEPCVASA